MVSKDLGQITEIEFLRYIQDSMDTIEDTIHTYEKTFKDFQRLYRDYVMDKKYYKLKYFISKEGVLTYEKLLKELHKYHPVGFEYKK